MDIKLNLSTESVARAYPAEPVCVEPEATVREVLDLLKERRVGSVLICRQERLIGIFTERDALRLFAHRTSLDASIESVMTRNPVVLHATDTVGEAIKKMSTGGYRHLPIVDPQNRPVGMVRAARIVHYLVEHFPKTVYNQPPMAQAAHQEREGA